MGVSCSRILWSSGRQDSSSRKCARMEKATSAAKPSLFRLLADVQLRGALWSGILLSGFWLLLLDTPIGPLDGFGLVDFRARPLSWMELVVKVITGLVIAAFNFPGLIVCWLVCFVLSLLLDGFITFGMLSASVTEYYSWIFFPMVFVANTIFYARKHIEVLAKR